MPYKVVKVKDGYTVRNKAIQVTNDTTVETNAVLTRSSPSTGQGRDRRVGGESIDGRSVQGPHLLYQLDSSVIPADAPTRRWTSGTIEDALDPAFDQNSRASGPHATRDRVQDGQVIAAKGEKIAGSGFDSSRFGGDLFTATATRRTTSPSRHDRSVPRPVCPRTTSMRPDGARTSRPHASQSPTVTRTSSPRSSTTRSSSPTSCGPAPRHDPVDPHREVRRPPANRPATATT